MDKSLHWILCLFLIVFSQETFAQQADDFEKEFQNAAAQHFDSSSVDGLLQKYASLLMPFNQVSQLAKGIEGKKWIRFPLVGMREKSVYKQHIGELLQSRAAGNRVLAYLMISAAGDTERRKLLGQRLQTETAARPALWLGMALMHLGYEHTSEIFQWMVRHNMEASGFLFPLFSSLPKDSLRQTAYQFASSADWNERVYAIQLLAGTGYTERSDSILKQAIRTWPVHLKGYAIVPARSIRAGNLLPVIGPFLDSTATRNTGLAALADSPTPEDRLFVKELATRVKGDKDIMDALKGSTFPDMQKSWLNLLPGYAPADQYIFFVHQDTLLRKDTMLPFVQESLRRIRNDQIRSQLLPLLNGRSDSGSQDLLLLSLVSKDDGVRYYASVALEGTCSGSLKTALQQVIDGSIFVTPKTFDLAVGCGMDQLQKQAEAAYHSGQEHMTAMSALNYLATYPSQAHLPLFREALKSDPEADYMAVRTAAKGLANLNDTLSIGNIIAASDRERKKADSNTAMYLEALGKLKGEKARAYVTSFLTSDNAYIKKLASDQLLHW